MPQVYADNRFISVFGNFLQLLTNFNVQNRIFIFTTKESTNFRAPTTAFSNSPLSTTVKLLLEYSSIQPYDFPIAIMFCTISCKRGVRRILSPSNPQSRPTFFVLSEEEASV